MEKQILRPDVFIIGAGPAGITAAIYAVRAGLSAVISENAVPGGQISRSSTVENYPGFESISGAELAGRFRRHLYSLGTEIDEFDPILRTEFSDGVKRIFTENHIYEPETVIIASGASPKKLPLESAAKFEGKGVHYCALCDGQAYKGRTVGVVGGGSAAAEEALYLSGIAEKVFVIRRKDYFRAERYLVEKMENTSNIEILYNTDLTDLKGEDFLECAEVRDISSENGKKYDIPLSAVFVCIGSEPGTELLRDNIDLDEYGYIITDEDMKTNISGVFAAGDVRKKHFRQIVNAVSDGAAAALSAEKYISGIKTKRSSKMIKIFSSDSCGYCTKLKAYLDSRKIRYDVIDVDESRENYDKLVEVSGQTGIPVSVFDSGDVVIGFDKPRIDSILGI